MKAYVKRVGGLVHFRLGRFGGSFYIAKRTPPAKPVAETRFAEPLYNRVAFIAAAYASHA